MIRALLGILLLGLALAGCGTSQPTTPGQGQQPRLSVPDASTMVPTALRIPSIGVDSRDEWDTLGIQGENGVKITPPGKAGQIEVPSIKEPMKLGWYCPSGLPKCGAPVPGQMGPAVVLGHINGGGKLGVFAKLSKVKVGAIIEIDRADNTTLVFKVVKVAEPLKTEFPTQAVYGDTTTPALRLITCGGGGNELATVNGQRSYVNQTIVYADEVEQRPTR